MSEKTKHKHLKTNPILLHIIFEKRKTKKIGTNPILLHIIFEKRKTKKKLEPIQSRCTSYLKNAKRKNIVVREARTLDLLRVKKQNTNT